MELGRAPDAQVSEGGCCCLCCLRDCHALQQALHGRLKWGLRASANSPAISIYISCRISPSKEESAKLCIWLTFSKYIPLAIPKRQSSLALLHIKSFCAMTVKSNVDTAHACFGNKASKYAISNTNVQAAATLADSLKRLCTCQTRQHSLQGTWLGLAAGMGAQPAPVSRLPGRETAGKHLSGPRPAALGQWPAPPLALLCSSPLGLQRCTTVIHCSVARFRHVRVLSCPSGADTLGEGIQQNSAGLGHVLLQLASGLHLLLQCSAPDLWCWQHCKTAATLSRQKTASALSAHRSRARQSQA